MDVPWQGKNNAKEGRTVSFAHRDGVAKSEYEDVGGARLHPLQPPVDAASEGFFPLHIYVILSGCTVSF
jgi:hypothetical protein